MSTHYLEVHPIRSSKKAGNKSTKMMKENLKMPNTSSRKNWLKIYY